MPLMRTKASGKEVLIDVATEAGSQNADVINAASMAANGIIQTTFTKVLSMPESVAPSRLDAELMFGINGNGEAFLTDNPNRSHITLRATWEKGNQRG